jgi:arylsulfatase A-like enzyme
MVRLLLLLLLLTPTAFAQKRPNIIYIMADDLGYADLSCYGRKDYTTPNLDKLSTQGVKLMNAYATAPVCTPTRVSFYTGRYPARTRVGLFEPIAEGSKDSTVGLPTSEPTIARLLKKQGYSTYLVGKWHLGYTRALSPNKHGFDYFFGFHAGAMDYISHSNDLYENEERIEKDGYATDLWADKAVELITMKKDKPYFMAVMFNAPHWPWQGPGDKAYPEGFDNWKKGGSAATYARMVKSLDDAVGKIVAAVDKSGSANNTVIIFTSDNGGERYSDNGIYKGGKMTVFEGGIREPAFVRWPDMIKPNTVSNQVVTTMDWTATMLALGRAKAVKGYPLDGWNVMPILMGKQKEKERTLYWRIFQRNNQKAVRSGKWKYLKDKDTEYLFDLEADPRETTNLAKQNPVMFKKLQHQMQAWEKTVLKPIPLDGTSKE